MSRLSRVASAVLVLASAGCITIQTPAFVAPAPARTWPSTLAAAQGQATAGKFDAADSLLASFATRYPGTGEALETAYWRAMFKMDPSNPHASLVTSMALLDGYLADPRQRAHVAEATTVRRAVAQLDGLTKLAANAMSQARNATTSAVATAAKLQLLDAKAQTGDTKSAADVSASADAEIKRLKDELAKANAELERIRKRLAQPPARP